MSETELIFAIKRFYSKPGNECGGVLHIALDDGNLTDENLHFCQAEAYIEKLKAFKLKKT